MNTWDLERYLEQTHTVLITREAFEYIKERATILDEIRTKIKALPKASFWSSDDNAISRDDVLDIIDEYDAAIAWTKRSMRNE